MARNFWTITITDPDTGESKYLTAATRFDLNLKVERQYGIWERRAERLKKLNTIEELKEEADELNLDCLADIDLIKNLLRVDDYFTIDEYFALEPSNYKYPKFKCSQEKPNLQQVQKELNVPKTNKFLEFFFRSIYHKRLDKEDQANQEYLARIRIYEKLYNSEFMKYQINKDLFEKHRLINNLKTLIEKRLFLKADKGYIEKYVQEMLLIEDLPSEILSVVNTFETQYLRNSKTMIISRILPTPEILPEFAGYKYVASKKTVEGIKWKQKEFDKLYEDLIFQLALKSVRDSFMLINDDILDSVVFNGWASYIDSSRGKHVTSCILSLHVKRHTINDINFELVNDYKNCIKSLKGIFNPNVKELIPVLPILEINRSDKRFINDVDVSSILYDGYNLATMEWEDFEYLIRQLFEKLFTFNNSEVKVTQASRDGGVDAIAFDPDPIRGGKFVIQAKRYNILVPVSAVRDLYGTMMHEGATRGILVTTSNFGKDAYSFAQDKPITLINGNELLGLLHNNGFENTKIKLNR